MGCCIGELRDKDVINICDGKRLGCVIDVEIDLCTGRLISIVVPGNNRLFNIRSNEITIPWERIERIGNDTILVNIRPQCGENGNCCKK